MSHIERIVYLRANRVVEPARERARFEMPVPRAGRFAWCVSRGAAAPAIFDASRAEAAERTGVPRRHAPAILF